MKRAASYVISSKRTGHAIAETFNRYAAERINRNRYTVEPIDEYLARINREAKPTVYTIRANGETYHLATLAEAQAATETIHQQTGAIAGIEQEPRT